MTVPCIQGLVHLFVLQTSAKWCVVLLSGTQVSAVESMTDEGRN